ncbi:MAG: glycosyltransferase, partial [Desulfofustis sp.]
MRRAGVDNVSLRLLLTGGGTGGHLFPAVATAEKVMTCLPGSQTLFIGTRRRLDRDSLSRYGFTVKTIHSYGLKGKSPGELAKALLVLPLSLIESGYHILRFRPDVVMGVGGYVTGPVVAAAWMLGKPTLIHEQNSVPGLANRLLGRLVRRICLSLPQSESFFPAHKSVVTGNPVRTA